MKVTTTSNIYPTTDITHKPKRVQGKNFPKVEEAVVSISGLETDVPKSVTIEKAINYYESNANGDMKNLYTMTAKWLRALMSKSLSPVDRAEGLMKVISKSLTDKAKELSEKSQD